MTSAELGALADRATMRPCTLTQARQAGLCTCPMLLDLADRPGWLPRPSGGAVIYQRRIDWDTTPRTKYAELWVVVGSGTRRQAFWSRGFIGRVESLDMPIDTEDERAALLAALPVPS
jgi:hypothetical protein